jgi:hypothetical protein
MTIDEIETYARRILELERGSRDDYADGLAAAVGHLSPDDRELVRLRAIDIEGAGAMTRQEIKALALRLLELEQDRREVAEGMHAAFGHLSHIEFEIIKQRARELEIEIDYNTAHDLQLRIDEDVIMTHLDPTVITAETIKLLDRLEPDVFTVRRIAKDIAKTIAREHEMQEPDMADVIQRLDAVRAPLNDWLKQRGVRT